MTIEEWSHKFTSIEDDLQQKTQELQDTKEKVAVLEVRQDALPLRCKKSYFFYTFCKLLFRTRNCFKHPKTQTKRFYHEIIPVKDTDGIANSEDPDQTAPLGKTKVESEQTQVNLLCLSSCKDLVTFR